MALSTGERLGPYQLLTPIGEGGMGEVWKALDTRLDRSVAIKFSKEEFSERFEREARAVAALNHPNICQLYDVGPNYLVMEYIEGTPVQGPMPMVKAIDYAGQILDALDAAHKKRITHRDLKPANILATKQGIKLLDFGLAKQQPVREDPEATVKALTVSGTIAGTLQYMSPEQLQGKEVDSRSDIFSFGCVFYEMLSGKRAFDGESVASIIGAVLHREPAPIDVAEPLALLIQRCLAKDPEDRFQNARDLRYNIALAGRSFSPDPAPAPARTRWRWPLWAAVIAAAASLGAFMTARWSAPEMDTPAWKFTPLAGESARQGYPRWSPDGKSITYTAEIDGVGQVFVRTIESPLAVQLTNSKSRCTYPVFSPDGQKIYYTSMEGTRTVIWSVSAAGGAPTRVLEGIRSGNLTTEVVVSPDGNSLLIFHQFDDAAGQPQSGIGISSPPGTPLRPLPNAPGLGAGRRMAYLSFSKDGRRLLIMLPGPKPEIWMAPWPAASGPSRRLLVRSTPALGGSTADWWTDNRHILMTMITPTEGSALEVLDSDTGVVRQLSRGLPTFGNLAVSAQGRLAFSRLNIDLDLIDVPLDNQPVRPLLATLRNELLPQWSPVAPEFAYFTDRAGELEIWLSDSEGKARPVVAKDQMPVRGAFSGIHAPVFSPDGRRLAFQAQENIYIANVNGGTPIRLLPEGAQVRMPAWSPDDQWIAYYNFNSGFVEKVRVGTPGASPIVKASQSFVLWSPDGKWITAQFPEGFGVVSPDGQTRKILRKGVLGSLDACGWARNGATLYVAAHEEGGVVLWEYNVNRNMERRLRDIGNVEFMSFAFANVLSPSPDGRSLLTTLRRSTSEIWMLEGLRIP